MVLSQREIILTMRRRIINRQLCYSFPRKNQNTIEKVQFLIGNR